MCDDAGSDVLSLEQFREYLLFLARMAIHRDETRKIDASDIVQETLLEAHRKIGQFRGSSAGELAQFLRKMLVYRLTDERRALRRDKRAVSRERSLEAALEDSSAQLGACLASKETTASQNLACHERAVQVAFALAQLGDSQNQAIRLRYFEGLSVKEISKAMNRSPEAVAGLLKRASEKLGALLPQEA